MKNIQVFTDGGARGNPGPGAIGVIIKSDDGIIAKIADAIGQTTNNVAEYKALIRALEFISENREKFEDSKINFFMDSELIYSQIKGLYKIKNEKLKVFVLKIKQKESELGMDVSYHHIPREKNKEADLLVNMALDGLPL